MKVRFANINDISDIVPLMKKATEFHYEGRPDMFIKKTDEEYYFSIRNLLEGNTEQILVIENDDLIIGYMGISYLYKKIKILFINQFFIDENYRLKGYGKEFMHFIEILAQEKGCERIELNCWAFNNNAIEFYKHLGFDEQRIIFEKNVNND